MIKKVENMKKILFFLSIVATGMLSSCGGVYDNIGDYATEETVYVGKFDALTGAAGFERVEINLLEAGRIPSNEIKLGKAKKTVVEYDDQVITYDEVKSWVNVTGLTTPKLYRFLVYNIDEFGNKSVPEQIALIPYTTEDFNSLVFPDPFMNISPTAAEITWSNGLSSTFFEFVDMIYTYTDVNGTTLDTIVVENPEDPIRFVMLDMEPSVPVQVSVKCRIIPKVSGEKVIDTVPISHSFSVTPTTVEEYLASRAYRTPGQAFVTATGGRIRWNAATDHLVLTEVRYKTNSGELKVIQTPASEMRTNCPDIKPGELYEYRCGYVPTAAVDTFYNAWRPSTSTFKSMATGTYTVSDKSYRGSGPPTTPVYNGGQAEYSSPNNCEVIITEEATNRYKITDLFGGFYAVGRGYGDAYDDDEITMHPAGIFTFDGANFKLIEAELDYWRTGFQAIYGTWDGENETLYLTVPWGNPSTADYTFYLMLILE
jgi:hypothetical protein